MQTDLGDRVPFSTDMEVAVLGGMLVAEDAVTTAVEFLRPDDFYHRAHKIIYEAMVSLFREDAVIDVLTLKEKLTASGKLAEAGGASYLAELLDAVPHGANIEYHCEVVKDKAVTRRLLSACQQTIRDIVSGDDIPTKELLDVAESRVFEVAGQRGGKHGALISDLVMPVMGLIEDRSAGTYQGVMSGYADLDRMTCGFQNGDFVVVAARPSMGKTAWALNVIQRVAIQRGISAAIYSLEMSKEALTERLLAQESMVDAQRIRTGKLTEGDYHALSVASGRIYRAPIWIDDTPGMSILELRAKARRLKATFNPSIIVVDYLQLMGGSSRSESREREVSEISRGLKAMARELQVPVIGVSQLSRAPEARQDKTPMLSDLRESGSIEQDADLVIFLYRESYYSGDIVDGKDISRDAELILAKQRNGPTGHVPLYFNKGIVRFDSVVR